MFSFGRGVGFTYNCGFKCNGHESTLSHCKAKHRRWSSCEHYQEAGVECRRPRKVADTVRISGGYSGFLEVKDDVCNQWYRVCDKGWGLAQARVVCRELDLGFGKLGSLHANSDNVTYINVGYRCTGDECQLADCITEITGNECQLADCITEIPTPDTPTDSCMNNLNEADDCASGFAWVECSPGTLTHHYQNLFLFIFACCVAQTFLTWYQTLTHFMAACEPTLMSFPLFLCRVLWKKAAFPRLLVITIAIIILTGMMTTESCFVSQRV